MKRLLALSEPGSTVAASSPESAEGSHSVGWSDGMGMLASIGCAIHCAAMPFVISFLPALGLGFLADESFHQWMAVGCFAIALAAFVPGFRKHGRWTPALVGIVGLAMISVAAFGFAGDCCAACTNGPSSAVATSAEGCSDACCTDCEARGSAGQVSNQPASSLPQPSLTWFAPFVPWLTPLGGIVLVVAHLLNHRGGCRLGCCPEGPAEGSAGHDDQV